MSSNLFVKLRRNNLLNWNITDIDLLNETQLDNFESKCKLAQQKINERKQIIKYYYWLEKKTAIQLSDYIVYGYMRQNDQHQIMIIVIIKLIKEFYHIPTLPSLTLEQAANLNIGDKIDHRDNVGRFVLCSIIKKEGTNLLIHYKNWSNKWDVWSNYKNELTRFAIAYSISRRKSYRFTKLKVGDYVNILHPKYKNLGWKHSKIRKIDQTSGQIQIEYRKSGDNRCIYLFWTHLDNDLEVSK